MKQVLLKQVFPPLFDNFPLVQLLKAVDDSLDQPKLEVLGSDVLVDCVLQDIVAEASKDNLVKSLIIYKFSNNFLLKLVISLINGSFNQIAGVLENRQIGEVIQKVVVDWSADRLWKVDYNIQHHIVSELMLTVLQQVLFELLHDLCHLDLVFLCILDDFLHHTEAILVAAKAVKMLKNDLKDLRLDVLGAALEDIGDHVVT